MTDVQGEIFAAIEANDVARMRTISENYPDDLNVPSFINWLSWLAVAAGDGNVEMVRVMIEAGADPNQSNRSGRNAIDLAASSKNPAIVQLMLENGAVMHTDDSIRNPLFGVSSVQGEETDGMVEIARLLIEAGIDTTVRYNTKTMKDMDAMAFAWMWGCRRIARLIAETQAKGDPEKVEALLAMAAAVSKANTVPVPPGEENYPAPS